MHDHGPDIHSLSGAYAVDALDELERARFEQHLASCPACLDEVTSLQEAAGTLAETSALAPPPELRERVLAGIGSVRPLPPPTATATATTTDDAPAQRADDLTALRGRRRLSFPLLVAAALIVVAGIATLVIRPWSDGAGEPGSRLTAADRVLAADDAQRFPVETTDGSAVEVVRSPSQDRAVVVADDMPAAPDGKVYQLWLQVDGEFRDAGLMPPGSDHTVLFEGDADAATGAGITVEPAGGSEQPTTDPVVLVDFSQA